MSLRKDYADLVKQAKKQGWEIDLTKGGHLKWVSPSGEVTFTSSSPSDPGGLRCHISRMKRMGFVKNGR